MRYRAGLACVVAALALGCEVGEVSAQGLTSQQRSALMQQQRMYEAQRQRYYQLDQRARRVERGLVASERVGSVAGYASPMMKWRAIPGMGTSRWVREYAPIVGRDYVREAMKEGVVKYGARRVFESNRVAPYNYRVWQKFRIVQ